MITTLTSPNNPNPGRYSWMKLLDTGNSVQSALVNPSDQEDSNLMIILIFIDLNNEKHDDFAISNIDILVYGERFNQNIPIIATKNELLFSKD